MNSNEVAFISAIILCTAFWLIIQAVGGPLVYQ